MDISILIHKLSNVRLKSLPNTVEKTKKKVFVLQVTSELKKINFQNIEYIFVSISLIIRVHLFKFDANVLILEDIKDRKEKEQCIFSDLLNNIAN